MDYSLKIGGKTVQIKGVVKDDEALFAAIGERSFLIHHQIISANHIHMNVDGIGKNVYLFSTAEGKLINISGVTYLVQDAKVLAGDGAKERGDRDIPQEITPPTPSVVVRIMVAEGELVEKGNGVVVLSAMKMETTLRAPFRGKVLKINVAEGERVMPGQILVDIESETASNDQHSRDIPSVKGV